jgi:hypothetical protein
MPFRREKPIQKKSIAKQPKPAMPVSSADLHIVYKIGVSVKHWKPAAQSAARHTGLHFM